MDEMAGGGGGGGKSNKASSSSSSGTGKGKKLKAAGGGRVGTGAPRKKSHEQMERRRERNRILARRTRLRKKFIFESLQKQVMDLKRQNTKLKTIVKINMAEQAPEVLGSCTARLPSIVTESMAEASTLLERGDFNLVKSLQTAQQSFVVTDPSLPDNRKYMWEGGKEGGRGVFLFAILVSLMCPRSFYWCFVLILIPSPPSLPPPHHTAIVFASQGFLDITGYSMGQVLGRNCRFLQGPRTDPAAVAKIRKGVAAGADTSVALLNYKADGTAFWNQFFVAPLRDLNGEVVYFVGAQCVINKPMEEMEEEARAKAKEEAEERAAAEMGSDEEEEED